VSQTVLLLKTLFSENLLSCVKPAVCSQMLKEAFCSTQNTGWDFSLAHNGDDKIPLNCYRL
jgi:hypothetical protein